MNLGYVNILPQATVESDALAPLCFLFIIIIFFFWATSKWSRYRLSLLQKYPHL